MANKFARGHNFTDGPPNDDVIAAYLHQLIEEATPTTAFVDDQVEKSLVTGDYAFIKDTPGNRLARVKTDALLGQVSSGITVGDIQVPDNAIQNAEMWYWQRGLNVDRTLTSGNIYGPDRFKLSAFGSWNLKIRNLDNQDLGLTGYPRSNRVARITAVAAHSTMLAGDSCILRYGIEGYDFASIDGLPWVFTMWVRTNRTGTMYMGIRTLVNHYDATIENYTQDALINPNGVTQVQLFFPARTSNLAYKDSNRALLLDICFGAGTDSQGPASTVWSSSSTLTTTRQTNFFDAANNYVDIWGPCLRTGSIAVPHRVNSNGSNELRRLQRYYAKSYGADVNPGSATSDGNEIITETTATDAYGKVNFPIAMRASPTVTIYNPANGAVNSIYQVNGGLNLAVSSVDRKTEAGFNHLFISGGTSTGSMIFLQYTAEADF
jgi:hypothetical protein